MPNVNINQGAPNNPLDTLIQQNHGSLYGNLGFNIENAFQGTLSGTVDPQLMATGWLSRSPYDESNSWQLNPTDQNVTQSGQLSIGGKPFTQLSSTSIGGPGEPIDPSLVTYDPKYGLITPPSNIKPISSGYGDMVFALAALGLGGATAMSALGSGGTAGTTAIDVSTSDLGSLAPSGLGGTGGTEGLVTGGAPVVDNSIPATGTGGGAPVVDHSVQAGLGTSGGTSNLSNLGRVGSLIHALTGGGGTGGTTGGGGMGGLMSILGLLGLGRQGGLFGGGTGTPSGAQHVAQQAADRADPWGSSGLRTQAQQALTPQVMMQLLGLDPSGLHKDITQDPGYQFALQQGTNAINVGDASQGTLHSGNRLLELQKYGTGLAAQYEGQFRNENLASLGALSSMAGLSSSSPVAAGNDLISGFTGATNLQNSGLNGLIGQLLGGGGGGGGLGSLFSSLGNGLISLLQGGGSGLTDFFNNLFGGSSGLSDQDISNLVADVGGGTTSDDLFGGFGDAFAGP